ncbi:cytochrome P450 [Pleomassaria siparia CBS 279.74]|uniref:Cytochrome P450 n=1 Tax=Pleomassaria siparia CBS 279.74 TaxID=1314801 RepID=A0A6G1KH03_9PLEO|nr:cytochrome P450 [Pleomassaria siparia CBS 279.74]
MLSVTMDRGTRLFDMLPSASISHIAIAIFAILTIQWIVTATYRIYFHPLRHFPGPKSAAISPLPLAISLFNGNIHIYLRDLHAKYGDVVRVSPEELSFIDPSAWKDICGHVTKTNHDSMPHKQWERYGRSVNGSYTLLNAPDVHHTRMRKIFNPAFSDRALKQQEPLFIKYADLLVEKLKQSLEKDPERKVDMVRYYNFTTFDVMGDLTFGEPLHMLEQNEYHSWVNIMFGGIRIGLTILGALYYFSIPNILMKTLLLKSKTVMQKRLRHFQYAVDRVSKRLDKGRESKGTDLWDFVLGQEDGKGLTRGEMDSNAALFMIAGTETTATGVSGITNLLLTHPDIMCKLVHEIRSSFSSSADMTMEALAALPYLSGCLKETLRLYPPVPSSLPKITPPAGSNICGHYIPGGYTVFLPHYAAYHSERNFKDARSFVPERWTGDERYADDKKAVLQPFSHGTRDCVGKNMAYHEMRLIIAKVLFNFDLELCPESANWADQRIFTLWEKKPLLCKLKVAY